MSTARKSTATLEQEIATLRHRVTQLEAIDTERQQTAAALRESEARQRVINESAFDYAFSFRVNDQGSLILDWLTEGFTRITGYATETLIGRPNPSQQYIHPDDLPQVTHTLRSLPSEQPTEYEFRIVTQDGSIRWLRSRARARVRQDGQPIRIDGATQDITERKHIEEALQQSEERLSLFLHHLPGVAFIKTWRGAISTRMKPWCSCGRPCSRTKPSPGGDRATSPCSRRRLPSRSGKTISASSPAGRANN